MRFVLGPYLLSCWCSWGVISHCSCCLLPLQCPWTYWLGCWPQPLSFILFFWRWEESLDGSHRCLSPTCSWRMEVAGQVFGAEDYLSTQFSRCPCAAVRTRAAPVKTRWPPRDIKLKLFTEQTNANLHGLRIWCVTIPFCVNSLKSVPFQISFFLFPRTECMFAGGVDGPWFEQQFASKWPARRQVHGPFPSMFRLSCPWGIFGEKLKYQESPHF